MRLKTKLNKQTLYFVKKLIMFSIGFFLYSLIEVLFRGYTYFMMGILGGIILLLVDSINNNLSWDIDLIWQGIIGSFAITTCELLLGEIFRKINIPAMWDYSNMPFNYDGVICLPFSIIWICISIVGILVADFINYYIFKEEPKPYYSILGKIFFTL